MIKNGTTVNPILKILIGARLTKMQCPTTKRHLANPQPLLPLALLPIAVLPLHARDIPQHDRDTHAERNRRAPPDDRRTEEVELDLPVPPSAHPQAELEEGPIERLRRKDVLLVWVRHERIVRRPHGDVEVDEVAPEG